MNMNRKLGKRVQKRKVCRECGITYDEDESWCRYCKNVLRKGQFIQQKYIEYFIQAFCKNCGVDVTTICFIHVHEEIPEYLPLKKFKMEQLKKKLRNALEDKYLCDECWINDAMQKEDISRLEAEELWEEADPDIECSCPL